MYVHPSEHYNYIILSQIIIKYNSNFLFYATKFTRNLKTAQNTRDPEDRS